jgi:hypothetical protein
MKFLKLLVLILITHFIAPVAHSIVSDGEKANANTFNTSFMSRESNTDTTGIVSLLNTDPASGPTISNLQAAINSATAITFGNESITAGGTVSIGDENLYERRTISGTPGPVTAAGVLFGTGPFNDAKTIRLVGNSDTSTVKVVTSDVTDGVVLRGTGYTMRLGDILDLEYNLTRRRWIEVNRSRETNVSTHTIKADENIRIEPQTKVTITEDVEILDNNVLELKDATGGEGVSLRSPDPLSSSYVLTLPPNDGNSNQLMFSNGSGILDWKDIFIASFDNRLLRSDTVGDAEVQESGITVDDINNMTGVNDITPFSLNGTVVSKYVIDDAVQTITNKTINGGTLDGQTASFSNQWIPPRDTKGNLDLLCPSLTAGSLVYATDQNKYYLCDGATLTELGAGAGGGGGINYITNPDAEDDLSGWTTYDDGGSDTPLDGTGGTPSSSLGQGVTDVLRGSFDFSYTTSTSQGDGISTDFTIDNADQSQILRVAFDYSSAQSPAGDPFVDGSMRVYVFNTTGPVAPPIEINPRDIKAGKGKFEGYFQTLPSGSPGNGYRLILHAADNNSYTVQFDNFFVGPATPAVKSGPIVLSAYGSATQVGTTTSGTTVEFDSTLVDTMGGFNPVTHTYTIKESGSYYISANLQVRVDDLANRRSYTRIVKNGSTAHFYSQTLDATASTDAGISISKILDLVKGDEINIQFQSLDDASWTISHATNSSSFSIFKISSDDSSGSGRVIAFSGWEQVGAASAPADNTNISVDNVLTDTTNSYDSVNNRWVVPESGYYQIQGCVNTINMAYGFFYYTSVYRGSSKISNVFDVNQRLKNGVADGSQDYGSGGCSVGVAYLDKGENISLRITVGGKSINGSESGSFRHKLSIHKVEGAGSSGALGKTVGFKASSDSSQVIGTSLQDLIFEDLSYDYTNSYSTSTGVYTVPESGLYTIKSTVAFSANVTGVRWIAVDINGVLLDFAPQVGGASFATGNNLNTEFQLNKGDLVKIRARQTSGAGLALNPSGNENYFIMRKVGN